MLITVAVRAIFTVVMVLVSISCLSAPRTDIVVLVNGDDVHGEIKTLEFGSLEYETDSLGTVNIDWEDITSIATAQYVEVETASGDKFYGSLEESDITDTISVGFGSDVDLISKPEVVRIVPIARNEHFFKRLEGSFSFGFTSDKSSDVTQATVAADIRYRATDYLIGLTLDTQVTDQKNAETTERHNIGLNFQRFRADRWFVDWTASAEQNDELGINLRVTAGAGLGRYLVQTNRNQFSLVLGLVGTRESFTSDDSSETNAEGRVSARYLHRSIVPESDVTFTTDIFPLLKDLSSYRSESNLTFRREFVKDLFLDLSIYYTYLSDPTDGAAKDDYGVTTSVGYSF